MDDQMRKADDADKMRENTEPGGELGEEVKPTSPDILPLVLHTEGLSLHDSKDLQENIEPTKPMDGEEMTVGGSDEDEEQKNRTKDQRKLRWEAEDEVLSREHNLVAQYVRDHSPQFCELAEIRLKGWKHPDGKKYFEKQRYHTDNADRETSRKFMRMMRNVADKMQNATGIFKLTNSRRPTILGFGFAPGGFIEKALAVNPTATAIGFSIGPKVGGIPVLIKDHRLCTHNADVTLMACDIGMDLSEIPADHPDAKNFLPKMIRPRAQFDLVTNEGGVLRPHVAHLGPHREAREAFRLRAAQLAMGLARVKPGGKMIMLMHKAESWSSLSLFYLFSKFSNVQLFKPDGEHQYKSSFYMLATDIKSQSQEAQEAVKMWTRDWQVACFGTEEEYKAEIVQNKLDVDKVLLEFGEKWVTLSRDVWERQKEGLKTKTFTQDFEAQ